MKIPSNVFIKTTPLFSLIDNLLPAVLNDWHGGPPTIKSIFSFFFNPAAFLISWAEYKLISSKTFNFGLFNLIVSLINFSL